MGNADASLAPLAVPKPEPPALALYPGGGVGCTGQRRGRLHIGLYSGTTGAMTGTNVKLVSAVEACCPEPVRARASARATGKSPANPHYAVRAALQSRVFCVSALADRCARMADFRLCAAKRGTTASVANSSINRAPIPRAISPDTHRRRPRPLGTLR